MTEKERRTMRFGVCAGIDKAPQIADAGYDYIELSVAGDLMAQEDEAAWAETRHKIEAMPLRPESYNSFVRTLQIVGPDADAERLRRYVETALARAAQVGGDIIVFGSGGARKIPDGFPQEQASQQLTDFLNLCADVSDCTGVRIAIEPLCRAETNVINLVSEGTEWARKIGRQGVGNLADTFHMEAEQEPMQAIVAGSDVLLHTHTADTHRLAPGTGTYDHVAFFAALRQAGYDARCSIECGWDGKFDALLAPALAHLRQAYETAQQS